MMFLINKGFQVLKELEMRVSFGVDLSTLSQNAIMKDKPAGWTADNTQKSMARHQAKLGGPLL